jgi:hypothetical protein
VVGVSFGCGSAALCRRSCLWFPAWPSGKSKFELNKSLDCPPTLEIFNLTMQCDRLLIFIDIVSQVAVLLCHSEKQWAPG